MLIWDLNPKQEQTISLVSLEGFYQSIHEFLSRCIIACIE